MTANYLNETHLLSDCQWGLRARSIVGALLATTHWFSLSEGGKETCDVFDYCKAFNSMPHHPLLNKLETLDVSSHVLQWFELQCVVLKGASSESSFWSATIRILPRTSFLIYVDEISS